MPLLPRRAPLARLAEAAGGTVIGDPRVEVRDVVADTRAVLPGSLFCCVPGGRVDGHDLAGDAAARGAVALLVERPLAGTGDAPAAQLLVGSVRSALGPVAASFWGSPSSRLELIGVTGTNGKTTTTYMVEAIARGAGRATGVIGTVEVRVGTERRPVVHTTPEAPDLQRLLAELADSGARVVAMEVSSHGLALGRVNGTRFRVAVFTNLTQDHLDFHRDLEDYFQAKARLFTADFADVAVVNVDDEHGRRLAAGCRIPVVTMGTRPDAAWRASRVDAALDGTGFELDWPDGRARVRLPLAGRFNVANALGALAASDLLGIAPPAAIRGLEALARVPGRFERVDAGQPFTVLVDYAHTPDSLERAIGSARALGPGRVLVVFGCGGDRDRAKRPVMGEIAGRLADAVIVTSDNPRSEPPLEIVEQILGGARRTARPDALVVEPDRRAAIRVALELAGPGDLVLVAGKGHEQGQEVAGGRKVPFDDRTVVCEALAEIGIG